MDNDFRSRGSKGVLTMNRRQSLKLLGIGSLAPLAGGLLARQAFAAENDVLLIIHPAFSSDWSPLRGGGQSYRLNSFWVASPLYYTGKGELKPYIFAKWSANADNTVWQFEIADKARFSDGSPITAADVKGSWELAAMPATKNQRIDQVLSTVQGYGTITGGKATVLEGVVALNDRTIEVRLSAQDPMFAAKLANHLAPIVKVSLARGADGNEVPGWWNPTDHAVVVSGPFVPVKMDLDAGIFVFERNANFSGPAPSLRRIEVQVIEDASTATAALKSGQFDVHTLIQTTTLIDDLGADFLSGPLAPEGDHFWLNISRKPTDDINVRKALISAVDREQLWKLTFPQGPEVRATQILTAVPGIDPNFRELPFDPDAARRFLAQSSYGSAAAFPRINFVGISRQVAEAAAQYIAEQWRTVLGVESVAMKPQIDKFEGPDQNRVQIFRDNVGTRVSDSTTYLRGIVHSSSSNAKNKLGGYKNEQVDALLDKASILAAGSEERLSLARQAQQLAADDAIYIPWAYRNMPQMAMPWVKGIEKNMDWQVSEPWNVTVSRS